MFAYCSLALVAQTLAQADLGVIADARRGAWHYLSFGSRLRRVEKAGLAGQLVIPEGFRHWAPLPEGVRTTPYGLDSLFAQGGVAEADLFRKVAEPDAFLHEEPAYATWSPQIHRAR
jgi:tRNA threonylcarbamoyladenosine biosynthesis protein TsaB